MALAFFVNAGSRDETAELAGVSHFLEHMAFKGTTQRTAADVNRELDEIGSQSNAYTSEEHTVYYAAVLPDYQDRALHLLADIMRPALRQEDFDTEKKVIIEEIHKYDDQPPFGAHEKCMARFFGNHPLGQSVLGTAESVSALSRDAMFGYFQRRYSPGNMTLVAAGHVDFDRLVALADQYCGKWPACDANREIRAAQAHQTMEFITREAAAQQYAVQIAGGPPAESPSRFSHRLMSAVFGDESGSRLFWSLVDCGLAEYAVTGTYEFQGAGITMTFLSCHPDAAQENLLRLQELQAQIEDNGVTEEELELAKSKTCSQVVRRAERPVNRLFSIGNNWIQRRAYLTVKDAVTAYQSVTSEDIAASLQEFPMTRCATVFAGPLQDPADATSAGTSSLDESAN
jgi:predicted Zn-dependent peptidase